VPWESSEGFLFGPVDVLGVDPAIDSWPLNTPDLTTFLNSNPAATKADVAAAGDDLRGFHAIE
jgi:putative iron-regulated protein